MTRFIKSSEKRDILAKLNEQFGISELPYLLIESGKERIKAFSGSLSKEEISDIALIAPIEAAGIYFARREGESFRLSFEGVQLMKEQITKNVLEITDQELELWIRGEDLEKKAPHGILVVKHGSDFFGCGKSTGEKVLNHVPKERRLKKQLK